MAVPFDHSERLKFIEMADEADRAKLVWMREYLRVGQFCTSHMREANVLTDGLIKAERQLESGQEPEEVLATLKAALLKAHGIKMDSTQPDPIPTDPRKAFLWMAEMEGLDTTVLATGMFFDRKVQKAWVVFQAGHKIGFHGKIQPSPIEIAKRARLL